MEAAKLFVNNATNVRDLQKILEGLFLHVGMSDRLQVARLAQRVAHPLDSGDKIAGIVSTISALAKEDTKRAVTVALATISTRASRRRGRSARFPSTDGCAWAPIVNRISPNHTPHIRSIDFILTGQITKE